MSARGHKVQAATATDPQTPHHWEQGPGKVTTRLHDDRLVVRWYLDRVAPSLGRHDAADSVRKVLKDPRGWERAGIVFSQTYRLAQAHLWVSVIPMDTTVCGKSAAGCYSEAPGRAPWAELGVELLADEGQWAEVVNMEIGGHGVFAMSDMYLGAGHERATYAGVMGAWSGAAKTAYYPSDEEVEDARQWLAGQAPYIHPGE